MIKISISISMMLLLATSFNLYAQNVGINTDGSAPDSTAMLDIKASDKGILLPRIALTGKDDSTTISSPTTSLLIYNTATAGAGANAVTPGFYYYNGTEWTGVGSSSDGAHYIGEEYGGGVIFHLWKDSSGVEHGLVVALTDQSNAQAWSNVTGTEIGASAQSKWDGLSNSNAIVGQGGHTASAAKLCLDLESGGQSDWYLPSIDELNLLWNNRFDVNKTLSEIGGATVLPSSSTAYWSSTEHNVNSAWSLTYYTSTAGLLNYFYYYSKVNTYDVRAIRAF